MELHTFENSHEVRSCFFLMPTGGGSCTTVLLDAVKGKTIHGIDLNPLVNARRTIEFDLTSGRPVVTFDVTVPEGVGYIYIESNGKATLEYSRTLDVQMIRFWQQMPFAPIQSLVGF